MDVRALLSVVGAALLTAPVAAQVTDATTYNRGIDASQVYIDYDGVAGTYYVRFVVYGVNSSSTPVDLSMDATVTVPGTSQSLVYPVDCGGLTADSASCTCGNSCAPPWTSCRPLNASACWCARNMVVVFAGPLTLTSANPGVHIELTPSAGAAAADSYTADDSTDTACTGTCVVNCDRSTQPPVLNVLDFTCFLNQYAAANGGPPTLVANCDGSTTPPVVNVLDFQCFLNQFAQGCPCP